ncbi:MAG: hypothetical protein HQK51_14825 [Oligoflexia bacterium]|nr:hypothetical protein [Oligoflexia bacterium]
MTMEKVYYLLKKNNLDLAEQLIDELLNLNKEHKLIESDKLILLNYLAFIKYFKEDFESCCSLNKKVIEIDSKNAYAHKGMGLALVKLNKIDEGILFLEKAIKIDPLFYDAYYDLTLIYYENNMSDKTKEIIALIESKFFSGKDSEHQINSEEINAFNELKKLTINTPEYYNE